MVGMLVSQPMINERNGKLKVSLHVERELSISAMLARRKVTNYLIDCVSDHLGGANPILLLKEQELFWRVPVMLYLTSRGAVGQVGEIDVDGQTGQLFISPEQIEELKRHATYLATRTLA